MAEKDGHSPPNSRVVRVRGNVARAARFDANLFALVSVRLAPSRRARRGGGKKAGEGARPARHGFFPLAQARVHGRRGRRARAAGVREVAVRKDGARVRRVSFFGVREAREAFGVDGVLRDEGVGEGDGALARSGGPTRAPPLRRRGGGDAKRREQNAFNETYRRVAPRRLPRPRTRPRSRGGASRADAARLLSGLGRRYRVGDFFDRPTARRDRAPGLARPRARAPRVRHLARARDATRGVPRERRGGDCRFGVAEPRAAVRRAMAFERRREDAFEDTGTKSEASSRLVSVRGVQNRNLATRSNAAGDAKKTRRLRDAKTRALPRRLARVLRRDASDAAAAPAVPRDDARGTRRRRARVGRQHDVYERTKTGSVEARWRRKKR